MHHFCTKALQLGLDFIDEETEAQRGCQWSRVHTARIRCLYFYLQVAWLLVQSQSVSTEPGSVLKAALISCASKACGIWFLLLVLKGEQSHRLWAAREQKDSQVLCVLLEERHPWVLPLPCWVNFSSEHDLSEPLPLSVSWG